MQEMGSLVLEIIRQESWLKMSLFEEKDLIQTLRHYSQVEVDFKEIEKLCQEINFFLRKASIDTHESSSTVAELQESRADFMDASFYPAGTGAPENRFCQGAYYLH